jgi:hypothetical protein
MSFMTYLVDGLFGLTALSSFAGFVFYLLTGNPDMALVCLVGIGGSAAIGWMFSTCRRAQDSYRSSCALQTSESGAPPASVDKQLN